MSCYWYPHQVLCRKQFERNYMPWNRKQFIKITHFQQTSTEICVGIQIIFLVTTLEPEWKWCQEPYNGIQIFIVVQGWRPRKLNYLHEDTDLCRSLLKMDNFANRFRFQVIKLCSSCLLNKNLFDIVINSMMFNNSLSEIRILDSKFYFHPIDSPWRSGLE
jgi:hypothetical protein